MDKVRIASFSELEVGKLADITVLSQNLLTVDEDRILDT